MEILGFDIPLWLLLILSLVFIYYKYMTSTFDAFKNSPGLKGPKPLPIFGNMLSMMKNGMYGFDKPIIEKYGKVVPVFQGRQPALIVSDVEILKEILIKQFNNFNSRLQIPNPPPLDSTLLALTDEQWKHVRNVVSPAFSADKLKRLNEPINKCCDILVSNMRKLIKKGERMDVRECTGAFTMDLIAKTVFGMDIDSQADPNNAFVRMAKRGFLDDFFNPVMIALVFAPFLLKPLVKMFKIALIPKDAVEFFTKIIDAAIAQRQPGDESRTDFLQLMINAQQESEQAKKKGLTRDELIAQGIIFFMAGFDSVANTCSTILYCLALNPEAQEKVVEEISKTLKSDEKPTYENVQSMKYLDMVINETLRMYPAAARSDRLAKNDITINGVFIPKDTLVTIPIDYFHHCPDIYPNPDQFDPERFTEQAKAERNAVYFQPFGMGPRHCVGVRLALMEVKMAMVHILRNFRVDKCEETKIPMKVSGINGRPIGLKLDFKERN